MTQPLRTAFAPVFLVLGLAATMPLSAQTGPAAPFTVMESGRGFSRLQDAVNAIGGGTGTIRLAAGRFTECAVQNAGDVTYVAAVPGEAVLDGVACEGKAALVLRGRSARVEGVVFANIRVPDKNGSGIRLEAGNLAVSQSWFRDSEQGILTGTNPGGVLTIDKSTFSRLGTCEGSGCAHSIYVGDIGAATVIRSRFEAGRGGHYVKSRAAQVAVINSSFDDSDGRGTNYMIDLPDGATGRITGNWFVQGRDKENSSAFIAVAPEHRDHSSEGLVIDGNNARFAPGVSRQSAFVANWSGNALMIGANTLGTGLIRYEKR